MTGLEQFMNGLKLLTEDALSDKRILCSHAVETHQDCYLRERPVIDGERLRTTFSGP